MIRCLITDGRATLDSASWMQQVAHWIREGVDLVQIRERDLNARNLAELTRQVLRIPNPHGTRVLVNDRADVAIACGAHGVHLRDGSVSAAKFAREGFLVSVACHRAEEALTVRAADFIVLAPIFKPLSKEDDRPALGVDTIRRLTRVCRTPVLALGGITQENACLCIEAGAAGIAGITYFGR